MSPSTKLKVASHTAELIRLKFGVPLIEWDRHTETLLVGIRKSQEAAGANYERDAGRREMREAFRNQGEVRTAVYDVLEAPAETFLATVSRAEMHMIGLHVARDYALAHPTADDARAAVELALKRGKCASALLDEALERWASGLPFQDLLRTKVQRTYVRLNTLAILSLFRKSLSGIRKGLAVFSDADAWAEVDHRFGSDIDELLQLYGNGHPDRLLVAMNRLVISSILNDEAAAMRAWRIAAEENPAAASLTSLVPGWDRPLAESPDMKWLLDKHGPHLEPTDR